LRAARHLYGLARTVKEDPQRELYMDQALTPVAEEDSSSLELLNQSDAARHAVEHERHVHELIAGPATGQLTMPSIGH
jgi:hypothetical protein